MPGIAIRRALRRLSAATLAALLLPSVSSAGEEGAASLGQVLHRRIDAFVGSNLSSKLVVLLLVVGALVLVWTWRRKR